MNAHRSAELYVSDLSIGEIHAGVERKKASASQFPHQLDAWASALRTDFANRTLDITTPIALRWASLSATLGRSDLDLFIAATALEHDLTVVTRNVRHFEPTGVKLINPYEA